MLISLALIFLVGLLFGGIFKKLKLPAILGILLAGIILGPSGLNLLERDLLNISEYLRKIALIMIMIRAGLALDLKVLKSQGFSILLISVLPVLAEIAIVMILGPMFFNVSLLEAAVLGALLSAIAPAVIVPRMIKAQREGYGTNKKIPQIIIACVSGENILAIVLFNSFLSMLVMGHFSAGVLTQVPVALILGLIIGVVFGWILRVFVKKFKTDSITNLIIILALGFLLMASENLLKDIVSFSGTIGLVAMAITFAKLAPKESKIADQQLKKIWQVAQIILFVLVGSIIGLNNFGGFLELSIIIIAIIARMIVAIISLSGSKLNFKEKLFTAISLNPKATVQAALGTLPLAMGLDIGFLAVNISVIAILITAPFGAICIDRTYKKLLTKE